MNELISLSYWLRTNGYIKFSQIVDELSEYEEPWHEEAVKEFGDKQISEEEYFDENISDKDVDPKSGKPKKEKRAEDLLRENGFEPHAFGSSDYAYIGQGAYGIVFAGIYKGTDAVAKVVINDHEMPDDQEVENWIEILKAKDAMPPELSKHIPDIYELKKGGTEEGNEYQIVIMERLEPLSPEMLEILNGSGQQEFYNARKETNLLKDDQYVFRLSKDISKIISKIAMFRESFKDITANDIMKEIMAIERLNYDGFNKITKVMSHYFASINKVEEIYNKESGNENLYFDTAEEYFYDLISFVIKKYSNKYSFPRDRYKMYYHDKYRPGDEADSKFWQEQPETSGLFKMLDSLYKNFEISWSDVHNNNIMQDKDGNLKIIDVGLYTVRK